jgi:nucleotide-binding universal stress UspA family protein
VRVLMVIANPLDAALFDADKAWNNSIDALASLSAKGIVLVERLTEASETALRKRLAQEPFHVLHFIGHGLSRPSAQYSLLVLEGSGRRARGLNAGYFGSVLKPFTSLRLVILQACEDGEPFKGIGAALIEQGLPAAVTLARKLNDSAMTSLWRKFYAALGSGQPLGAGLDELRGEGVEVFLRSDVSNGVIFSVAAPSSPLAKAEPAASELRVPSAEGVPSREGANELESTALLLKSELERKRNAGEFDVFLCHNWADKPAVKKIARRLRERGILPWLDEWELRPGQPWQPLLEQQISQIKSAAVFVGSSGLGPWQEQEIHGLLREFATRRCPVIPVLLPDAPAQPKLPIFLGAMTWVDFRVSDPDPMERLVWGITGARGEVD